MIDESTKTKEARDPEYTLVTSKAMLSASSAVMFTVAELLPPQKPGLIDGHDVHEVLYGVMASLDHVAAEIKAILDDGIERR